MSSEGADRIVGLEMGAGDYPSEPFAVRELLARMIPRNMQLTEAARLIAFGDWRLDTVARHLLDADSTMVALSGAEYRLLRVFLDHPQRVRLVLILLVCMALAQSLSFWPTMTERDQATTNLMMGYVEREVASSVVLLGRLPAAERAEWLPLLLAAQLARAAGTLGPDLKAAADHAHAPAGGRDGRVARARQAAAGPEGDGVAGQGVTYARTLHGAAEVPCRIAPDALACLHRNDAAKRTEQ